MIDLHCHILPGLDDGAADLEESLKMARVLVEHGFSEVVASPHVVDRENMLNPAEKVNAAVVQLNDALQSESIPLRVHPGAEYHFDRPLPQIIRNRFPISTMAGSLYMLIELPVMQWPNYFEYSVFPEDDDSQELRKFMPYVRPVIAHPERNQEVQKNHRVLQSLLEMGYLFQVNLESIVGWGGKHTVKLIKKMARDKLIHLIGTDGHNSEGLAKMLPDWRRQAERVLGKDVADVVIEENAGCVVRNEPIELED